METVLVTGASGFLGVHTVQALVEAGHRVRAMVRQPARLQQHLRPLGLADDQRVEPVVGDMTDETAVRRAAEGCSAVVHTAATFSFKRSDKRRMTEENAGGARTVLQAGVDAGCRALVHVSSTVALARPGGGVLDHTSPLGVSTGPYSASKIASEQVARELQDSGAPLAIVNPGGILGPHDPYLGENNHVMRLVLRGVLPAWPRGRFQYVDVRDVAAVLAAAVDHGGAGRFLVPGSDVARPHDALREVTGRRLPAVPVPVGAAVATAMPGDLTGWSFLPRGSEGTRLIGYANSTDASRTTQVLGVHGRPLEEAVRDTIRWMVEAGHVSPKQAGRALAS